MNNFGPTARYDTHSSLSSGNNSREIDINFLCRTGAHLAPSRRRPMPAPRYVACQKGILYNPISIYYKQIGKNRFFILIVKSVTSCTKVLGGSKDMFCIWSQQSVFFKKKTKNQECRLHRLPVLQKTCEHHVAVIFITTTRCHRICLPDIRYQEKKWWSGQ
jgi:hypothetical protein